MNGPGLADDRLYAAVSDADAWRVHGELTAMLRGLHTAGAMRGIGAGCDFPAWAWQLMDGAHFWAADGDGWGCELPASRMRNGCPYLLSGYTGGDDR